MHVIVEQPELRGNTVTFRWRQSEANPYQTHNAFSLRYDGLDVSAFSTTLWYEIFFALQSRIFALHPGEVTVAFPEPVPLPSIEYWLARRGASDRITVTPALDFGYSPWNGEPRLLGKRRIGILFGGGKDSMTTLATAHERYSPDELLLIRHGIPYFPGEDYARIVDKRDTRFIVEPVARKLGLQSARVWTDRSAILV